jgi:hypothetical protein
MRLPWKATPVLTGKDAARFIKRMHEAETRPITKKEKLEYEKAKKLYDEIKKKQGCPTCGHKA